MPTGRAKRMVSIIVRITAIERRVAILERRAGGGLFAPRSRSLLHYLEIAELEFLEVLADEHDGVAPFAHPLVRAMVAAAQARAAGRLVPPLVAGQPLRPKAPTGLLLPPR